MHRSNRLSPGALVAILLGVLVAFSGCGADNLFEGLGNPFGYGFCGLLLLVLDVLAIVEIINSTRSSGDKLLWSLVIIVFPFVGLLAYYVFGRK